MSKIKIGFEITDIWNIESYRNVIKALNSTPENIDERLEAGDIELFLISNDDSSMYIWGTGARIGLDSAHTIACATRAIKLQKIEDNQIQIFLDDRQDTVMLIDNGSAYADGILVDSKPDYYQMDAKWYTTLVGLIKRLLDELEG